MSVAPSPAREGPALTPDEVLWEATAVGLVAALGRKRGERFLRAMTDQIATRANMAEAVPIRSRVEHAPIAAAIRDAEAIYRRRLHTLIAALPYKGV